MLMLVGTGASGVSSRGSEEMKAIKKRQEGEPLLASLSWRKRELYLGVEVVRARRQITNLY